MLPPSYNPDDSIGVRHDTLAEARTKAESAKHQLRKTRVVLDIVADHDREVLTPTMTGSIREMQGELDSLIETLDGMEADIASELETVREEMSNE